MSGLKEETAKSRLVLQVHDELLVEADEREAASGIRRFWKRRCTGAANLAVRLEIDMHTGKNWYEAK